MHPPSPDKGPAQPPAPAAPHLEHVGVGAAVKDVGLLSQRRSFQAVLGSRLDRHQPAVGQLGPKHLRAQAGRQADRQADSRRRWAAHEAAACWECESSPPQRARQHHPSPPGILTERVLRAAAMRPKPDTPRQHQGHTAGPRGSSAARQASRSRRSAQQAQRAAGAARSPSPRRPRPASPMCHPGPERTLSPVAAAGLCQTAAQAPAPSCSPLARPCQPAPPRLQRPPLPSRPPASRVPPPVPARRQLAQCALAAGGPLQGRPAGWATAPPAAAAAAAAQRSPACVADPLRGQAQCRGAAWPVPAPTARYLQAGRQPGGTIESSRSATLTAFTAGESHL